jgi:hypothetical protein
MRDENGWKFEDIYIHENKGKPVGLWCSYIAQHPIAAGLQQVDWQGVLKNSEEVLKILQQLKQLADEDRLSKRPPENGE